MLEIIRKKRDGKKLKEKEIRDFVYGVKNNNIPDYQISSFLMAVFFKGLDIEETTYLTKYMIESGKKFDLSKIKGCKIDKHSTGGVGDKVSLILAPLAAEMGIVVPMISGRGLGHTGGTIDKLESISGYNSNLSFDEFLNILKKVQCSIISQTDEISPVDRELYALRDVTATVESIPLITSSILSKKLSEDLDGLVIDLKVGRGAFMKDIKSARTLGRSMKNVGENIGKEIKIVFTDQSSPLGKSIGNAPEVIESLEILKGNFIEDTVEVTLKLAEEMCRIAKIKGDIKKVLKSGNVYNRFMRMVKLHGGDINNLHTYSKPYEVKSKKEGNIESIDAYVIGLASLKAGAGRIKKGESIDFKAGIRLLKKEGNEVKKGETIALVYSKKPAKDIIDTIMKAYKFSKKEVVQKSKIIDIW